MSEKVLVVDDDKTILTMLFKALKNNGIEADLAISGEAALELVKQNKYDLILLDINMRGINGFEVIQQLRGNGLTTPVMVVSGRKEDQDALYGLEIGADDYITKPFSPKELVLRVNNIIRRTYRNVDEKILVDGYSIDDNKRLVFDANGTEIDLSTKEYELLMMFVKNRGTAFSREQILEQVWDTNYYGSDRVVDDTMRRLRRKMPDLNIHTIYGFGYRLG